MQLNKTKIQLKHNYYTENVTSKERLLKHTTTCHAIHSKIQGPQDTEKYGGCMNMHIQ